MDHTTVGSSGAERPVQLEEGGSSPTPTLKSFRVHLVPRQEIAEFVEQHHYSHNIIGVNSTYCFAFKDGDRIVGAMIVGRPAARSVKKYGKNVVEIRRLCCIDDTPKNTESRFIGYVIRWIVSNTKHDAVLAYSDLEHGHEGMIYAASNFKKVGCIPGAPLIQWKGKRYHDRSLRAVEGKLKGFSHKLRLAVGTGEAEVVQTKGKIVWLYRIKVVAKARPAVIRSAEEESMEDKVIGTLKAELVALERRVANIKGAIRLLGDEAAAKPAASSLKLHGRKWTEAEKKAMSLKQKARWANKKAKKK